MTGWPLLSVGSAAWMPHFEWVIYLVEATVFGSNNTGSPWLIACCVSATALRILSVSLISSLLQACETGTIITPI